MTILEEIAAHKRQTVAERRALYPVKLLEQSLYFHTPVVSLRKYLERPDRLGIIAEFKRRSPSKGDINPTADVEATSIGYMQAGASALSVLTDSKYFGGKNADLTVARAFNFCPILRKDFIVDEYQIIEARSIGADVILLIAEILDAGEVKRLAAFAKSLGLEVLLEIHGAEQLDKWTPDVDVIGVNNRNLHDFTVAVDTSGQLYSRLPTESARISESGLSDPATVADLLDVGYQGFLIGEHFMRHAEPAAACRQFIQRVYRLRGNAPQAQPA